MARSLFVPVHLHARLVTATTEPLPGLGVPFTVPTPGLPRGVHLHWALPDALTRATVDPLGQTLRFPAVPDRWLVVRFADAPTLANGLRPPRRNCTAFVVDAKNRKSGPLGAVAFTPVAEWLTVMGLLPDGVKTGQGGPLPRDIHLEAAYYPLARDRFGFHDDLADLAVADWSALRLSYLVVGSYTRSSEDPLARLGNDSERLDWLDDARLEVDLPRPRHVQATSVHHDPLTSVRRLDPALVSLSFAGDRKKQVSYPLDKLGELGLGPSATTEGRLGALRGEIDATQAVAAALSGIKLTPRPLLPTPDDDKGVPSRLVCHGAIVDLGPSGAYTGLGVLPNNPSCRIADSASAAIEEAFAGIGGGDVFAILRGGLDGELGDTTGMQALPYLLHAAGFDGAPDEAHTTELVATIRDTGPTLGLANLDPNAPVRVVDRRTLTGPTAPAAVAVKDLGTLPGAVTVEARKVPAPRWHRAGTPVVQIERAGRSFRHGHDGRMRQDGRLRCRASGQLVTEIRLDVPDGSPPGVAITGDRLVALDLALRREPAHVRDLIHELAVLDPSNRAVVAGVWLGGFDPAYHSLPLATTVSDLFRALAEGWWTAADPSALKSAAGWHFTGTLPAPFAVTAWHAPWLPLFAEIDYRFTPNTNNTGAGLVLEPHEPRFTAPTDGAALVVTAREVLSSAPADTLQSAIARIKDHFGKDPARKAQLDELVARLTSLDLQTLALGDVDPQLRAAGHAFRGGTLVVQRLRLVDTFGQLLQPPPPSRPLPPRLTTWARVQARLTAAQGPGEADPLRSPLCGCFVFDAVEQALEVFSPAGAALGQLRHNRDATTGVATTTWEPAPARDGVALDALPSPLRDVVAALAAPAPGGAGESALMAALKVMDGARFTVARRQSGDDYRGMLCRRPVLLLRVSLTLEVAGVGLGDRPDRGQPVKAPGAIKVRLGCAEQLDDGLLGFLARDQGDALRLHVVPAVAQGAWTIPHQVVHPIVDRSTALTLVPGVPVEVLLLLDGASSFHVQAGLLPRKRIDVQEVVSSRLLGQLRATLRVGPVLFDPGQHRVPAPELPGERWTLIERRGDGFSEAPLAPFSPALSELPERPVTLHQGWIRLDIDG